MDISEYYTIDEDGAVHIKDDAPVDVLVELALNTEEAQLSTAVASNPNTPSKVLDLILEELDEVRPVIRAIAGNPNTSVDALLKIVTFDNGFSDNWEDVKLSKNHEDEAFDIAARSGKFSTRKLTYLAKSNDYKLRLVAARNPNTPVKVLYGLFEHASTVWLDYCEEHSIFAEVPEDVNKATDTITVLCWNPSTPADLLQRISSLKEDIYLSGYFIYEAANNPNAPCDVLATAAVLDKSFMKKTAIKALTELANSDDEEDRGAARKALEAFTE